MTLIYLIHAPAEKFRAPLRIGISRPVSVLAPAVIPLPIANLFAGNLQKPGNVIRDNFRRFHPYLLCSAETVKQQAEKNAEHQTFHMELNLLSFMLRVLRNQCFRRRYGQGRRRTRRRKGLKRRPELLRVFEKPQRPRCRCLSSGRAPLRIPSDGGWPDRWRDEDGRRPAEGRWPGSAAGESDLRRPAPQRLHPYPDGVLRNPLSMPEKPPWSKDRGRAEQ